MPTTLGTPASTYIIAYEGDKIALEFMASAAVNKGQPVKLNATDSTIVPWVGGTDAKWLCIGITEKAITSAMISTGGQGPSGPLCTVVCRGYALVYGVNSHTVSGLNTGPVTTPGASTTTGFTSYCQYIAATDSAGKDVIGWSLDYLASGVDQIIRILMVD